MEECYISKDNDIGSLVRQRANNKEEYFVKDLGNDTFVITNNNNNLEITIQENSSVCFSGEKKDIEKSFEDIFWNLKDKMVLKQT